MVQGRRWGLGGAFAAGLGLVAALVVLSVREGGPLAGSEPGGKSRPDRLIAYEPRGNLDISGFSVLVNSVPAWSPRESLAAIGRTWTRPEEPLIARIDRDLTVPRVADNLRYMSMMLKASLHCSAGAAEPAYDVLTQARAFLDGRPELARQGLYTTIYSQGVASLRRGENDNCVQCRGESSCILPIAPSARHTNPAGSRTAIAHFTEYLERFPDDLQVRWLLNLAHMTLGEYPDGVDPRYRLTLDRYLNSEFDLGRFRDVGEAAGVNRFNEAGGAILDDFDNDGRLDLVMTDFDPSAPMAFYHNNGDGTFTDRAESAGLAGQLGGLVCYQADYDNDGNLDLFIPRGAWLAHPIRPSLLRNNGDGTFADVTEAARLLDPMNSNTACWGDYDNDGWIDLFVGCEIQCSRLYHNNGDGTFTDVLPESGLPTHGEPWCKGSVWIDYDNDNDPDLFLNHIDATARLYRNDGDGTFTDLSEPLGIRGPSHGFACWAFDYDNDGWTDLYATSYTRSCADVILGLMGRPDDRAHGVLWHNESGEGFRDMTRAAGLDMTFAAMSSNFGDFDNDGWLDFYLGTGDPSFGLLIPNRMFRNVDGRRFAEITVSAGTGHLQKGHGIAIGDYDEDGDADLFAEMGGAVRGDSYHSVLFQNPGNANHWLKVRLIGERSNRAAIGARITATIEGQPRRTIHREVTSGSSFGANPLRQEFGLGRADRVATLEVHWPTTGTSQTFRDIAADQTIEITEFAADYRTVARPAPRSGN